LKVFFTAIDAQPTLTLQNAEQETLGGELQVGCPTAGVGRDPSDGRAAKQWSPSEIARAKLHEKKRSKSRDNSTFLRRRFESIHTERFEVHEMSNAGTTLVQR